MGFSFSFVTNYTANMRQVSCPAKEATAMEGWSVLRVHWGRRAGGWLQRQSSGDSWGRLLLREVSATDS